MGSPILLLLFLFNINFINSLDVSIGGGGGSNGGINIGIGDSTPDSPSPVSSPGNDTPSDCPPPKPNSPPPQSNSPPPFLFLDERLKAVYPVIQNFKNKITSDPMGVTKTWNGSDICKYRGLYCDNPPDNASATALASIDFNGFGLAASSLEGFIENLKDLALFHANSNFFTGTISPKIANLPYLYEFDISNNRFTGSFPPALLAATNITFLDIRYNTFSGSVPAPIFSRQLDVLFVNNNNFMMKLPENFGLTTALYLTLANNKFIGSIPKSIGKASGLTEVLFLNNQLSGCLPYEIGYLNKLTVFDVGCNRLTGPIPCSFGCLDKIEQLNLAGNMFYGMVPEVVCALGNLANLSLSDNYFTHVGPYCWRLIQSGVLDVKKNCIHGLPGQRSIGECAAFFSQPRGCPYMASFIYLPCRPPQPWMQENTYSHSLLPPKAPSPSYAALIRHRL